MVRGAPSPADLQVIRELTDRDLAVTISQLESWRRVGLLPRHRRRGLGRGRGAVVDVVDPVVVESAAALARHLRQGRDRRLGVPEWFAEAGVSARPGAVQVPEPPIGAVREALVWALEGPSLSQGSGGPRTVTDEQVAAAVQRTPEPKGATHWSTRGALGFTGCPNLLHKYINQGRADSDRSHISPRRLARMLLTKPDNLKAEYRDLLAQLIGACPEMTQLASSIRDFAELLTPCAGNADPFSRWIVQVRAVDLPHLHAFIRGLDRDRDAVIAALTLPYSNGPTEGVNTKTKRIARQMHGRAGFTLLRHRILPG